MRNLPLTGTLVLLRTSLKHDGRLVAPWIAGATALSASSVLFYPVVFPDQADRIGLAAAIGANPAVGLIFGPAFDISTADGFNAWRSLALGGFLAGLGAIFTMTRATRAQEDSGQAELLASGVLGRATRLMTGVAMALIGSLVLGVVAGLATIAWGGAWGPSLLLAATFTVTGWLFAGAAAVSNQIGSDARTASSIAVAILGVLYVSRGVAYAVDAPRWSIWANPLGWMTETRPATGDHWWPLTLAVGLAVALLALAFALQARRDFGQGVIAQRPGPARGRDRSAGRLAVRLNRGPVITWTVAFVALGFVFGYFAISANDILGSDRAVQLVLAAGATTPDQLLSAFLVTILTLVGIIASVPGVQVMLKVRSEEMDDRVEPVIATHVTRVRYYASNVALALGTSAWYVLLAGLLVALLVSRADIGINFGDALLQAVATVPAVWTVMAVSVAVIGARPQMVLAAWGGVLVASALTVLGPTFRLRDSILAISPYSHIPNVTDLTSHWTGLIGITLVTAALVAVGFAGFRHRDLAR